MPRARKICGSPGCPNLQPCGQHARDPWAGSTRRARLPRDWNRRRRAVLARDPICRVCDNALSTQVDHVIPGDNHDLENLQGICDSCHRTKSAREGVAAR